MPGAGRNVTGRWVDLLLEYGFSYDSSLMADDFTPYYVRRGDEVRTDGPVVFGPAVDLVELPFDWSLDDWPYFSIHQPDHFVGLRDPSRSTTSGRTTSGTCTSAWAPASSS